MIFGRRNKTATDEVDETADPTDTAAPDVAATEQSDAAVDGSAADRENADLEDGDPEDRDAEDGDNDAQPAEKDDAEQAVTDEWAEFDLSRDWRVDGPFDFDEVDLEADEVERLDFGSMIITPLPECELRLQVAEGTDTIVSVLVVVGDSALELAAFSAPRTPGLWAEIRQQIIDQTLQAGGTVDCVEGPFSTELVRNVPVRTPEGQNAIQATRTWVAEGPRWLLRGVLMGRAALTDQVDDDLVGPFYDVFADVVVRRGDHPMPVGDLLELRLPPQAQVQSDDQTAQG